MPSPDSELTQIVAMVPIKSVDYQSGGNALKMECVAGARVGTQELIRVMDKIKRFLPRVNVWDVRSDLSFLSPGENGVAVVRWQAFTDKGRNYLMALGDAIAAVYPAMLQAPAAQLPAPVQKLTESGLPILERSADDIIRGDNDKRRELGMPLLPETKGE